MELNNSFAIPLAPDEAWAVLLDIARIAPCMPGAALTEIVDPQTYKGKVSVKLGPVALTFNGIAKFIEIAASEKRVKVEAQGTDAKGRGGAHASAVFRLTPSAQGTTVAIQTQLNLSGAVAQYGRGTGMIQSVASQLIDQFADNLHAELIAAAPKTAPLATEAAGDATPASNEDRAAVAMAPPRPAARPIAGLTLLWRALWASLKRALGAAA